MAQPTWTDAVSEYDILAVFSIQRWSEDGALTIHTTHKFSYQRSVNQGDAATWTIGAFSVDLEGYYAGNVTDIGSISYSFGLDIQPQINYPSMTIKIARDDSDEISNFITALEGNSYGGATPSNFVGLFVVEKGTTPSDSTDLKYFGYIDPNSVTIKRDSIQLRLYDKSKRSDSKLPNVTVKQYCIDELSFTGNDTSAIDEDWEGKPLPVLIGDWSSGDDYQIEVPCIYTTNQNGDFQFVLAHPMNYGLYSAGTKIRADTSNCQYALVESYTFDIENFSGSTGYFTAADSQYDSTDRQNTFVYEKDASIKFYVQNPVGIRSLTTDPVSNPAEVWKELITYWAYDTGSGDIDSTAYTSAHTQFENLGIVVRRWITDETQLTDLLEELATNCGLLTHVEKDVFVPTVSAFYQLGLADDTYYGCNFLKDSFKVEIDPGDWFATRIDLSYRLQPQSDGYRKLVSSPSDGTTRRLKTVEAKWLYDEASAVTRSSFMYLALGNSPYAMQGKLLKVGFDHNLSDSVAVEHADINGEEFQIFEIAQDFAAGYSDILAISTAWSFVAGSWTNDTEKTYSLETSDITKRDNGYWTNDSGLCDAADPDSENSHWT